MALTFTKKDETVQGAKRATQYDVLMDNAYPAGGYSVTPRTVGLTTKIDRCDVGQAGDYVIEPINQADGSVKLKVITSNGAAPAKLLDFTSSGDLSSVTARITFIGV